MEGYSEGGPEGWAVGQKEGATVTRQTVLLTGLNT
jgi:hypothetical protein